MTSTGCLAGKSVLIVENEWLIATDIRRELAKEGALVLRPVASVGRALLLISRTFRIDVAVLDVHLGDGGTVYPVAEALRTLDVPFMFATGHDDHSIRRDFADRPYLTKPFLPSAVVPVLAKTWTAHERDIRLG